MLRLKCCGLLVVLIFGLQRGLAAAQPFANAQPAPTSTPYFGLFQNRRSPTLYQTIVRPQIETIQRFEQSQRDIDRLERQQHALRQLRPPPALSLPAPKRGISQNIRVTGHETRFMDGRRFLDQRHFFPQQQVR